MLRVRCTVVALALLPRVASAQAAPARLPETAATLPDGVAVAETTLAAPQFPLVAGFHDDVFFLANRSHDFVIAPGGRLSVDFDAFFGDDVTEDSTVGVFRRAAVKDTFVLRTARIEAAGSFFDRFTYLLSAEFAARAAPIAADEIFDARIHPLLHVQLGQFDAPFTMENRTWEPYLDFMERSLAVRALGIPTNKEIGLMLWGESPSHVVHYEVGAFNGDGPNRLNRDNYFDGMARVFAHPLTLTASRLSELQIGASVRYGFRGESVDYAYPAMTTQGMYVFFDPIVATAPMQLTIVPDAHQFGVAGEVDLPVGRFDLRGEFVYVHNGTSEMLGPLTGGPAQRLGTLAGVGWYAQVAYWPWGTPFVNGRPGYELPLHVHFDDADVPLPSGLQLVLRGEGLDFRYDGGARGTVVGATETGAERDGRYAVYSVALGANLWLTHHVRFTIDGTEYFFPDQPGAVATHDDNHAHAPPHAPSNNAFTYFELSTRVGLVL
jgi:hypothetical protein